MQIIMWCRLSYTLFFLPFVFIAYAQGDSILLIDANDLIDNARIINNFDKRTEIGEIKNLYKLSVWHFAPGLSYDFVRNRYYVTVSTSGLVNHFIGKRQEKRRINAIERKYKAKNIGDELKIGNQVLAIQADYKDLILARQIVQIEIDIFMIQREQYEKNEIDTEKFLTSKKNIINTVKNHNSAVTELYKRILELSSVSDTPIKLNFSDLYFNLDFIDNNLND
jgi:hypothetical protein